jgi:hypothetical protein
LEKSAVKQGSTEWNLALLATSRRRAPDPTRPRAAWRPCPPRSLGPASLAPEAARPEARMLRPHAARASPLGLAHRAHGTHPHVAAGP